MNAGLSARELGWVRAAQWFNDGTVWHRPHKKLGLAHCGRPVTEVEQILMSFPVESALCPRCCLTVWAKTGKWHKLAPGKSDMAICGVRVVEVQDRADTPKPRQSICQECTQPKSKSQKMKKMKKRKAPTKGRKDPEAVDRATRRTFGDWRDWTILNNVGRGKRSK